MGRCDHRICRTIWRTTGGSRLKSASSYSGDGIVTVRYTDTLLPTCIVPRNKTDFDNLEIGPERQWAKQQLCWWPVSARRSHAVPSQTIIEWY